MQFSAGSPICMLLHPRLQALQKLVVDALIDDRPRAGRALLPLKSEGRRATPSTAAVEIGVSIHDDRVFAAHLENRALDPDLARAARSAATLLMSQADFARSGEGNETRLGMRNQRIAEAAARARDRSSPRLPAARPLRATSKNFAAMVGESLDGFRITVLPQTIEASVMPAMIAQGKFHGGITAPTPSGM